MSRVVFATDLHLTENGGGIEAFRTDLESIAELQPDLVVQGGDICLWEDGAGDQLQRLLEAHDLPVVHVMGNHDTSPHLPPDRFDADFCARFGPRNRHVDLGDCHVVTLNTCRMQPQYGDRNWHNVRGEVGEDDLSWLDATLAEAAPGRPLLLFVHIPLATTYPERRQADRETADVWRVTNAAAVHERLTAWSAPVVVGQGHLHENEHLHRGSVHYVTVGSVCGSWWDGAESSRCPDGTPRGWMVADVAGRDIDLSYHPAQSPAWRGEIVAQEGLWLDLFFGAPSQPVEIEVDGAWLSLAPPTPQPVRGGFTTTHRWRLPDGLPQSRLPVGTVGPAGAETFVVEARPDAAGVPALPVGD